MTTLVGRAAGAGASTGASSLLVAAGVGAGAGAAGCGNEAAGSCINWVEGRPRVKQGMNAAIWCPAFAVPSRMQESSPALQPVWEGCQLEGRVPLPTRLNVVQLHRLSTATMADGTRTCGRKNQLATARSTGSGSSAVAQHRPHAPPSCKTVAFVMPGLLAKISSSVLPSASISGMAGQHESILCWRWHKSPE